MSRLQIGGILWFVAGAMFAISWFLSQPRRPLNLVTGILFALVGIVFLAKGRRGTARQ